MFGAIILQFVLIFLNAVFASAEIAVISTNETKLQKMAERGDKRAKRLVKMTSQPARFLSTIQVAITLAGFLGSAFAADNFAGPLTNVLVKAGLPLPASFINSICVILITLILAYFNIVLGELVPKRIAMKRAEKTALGISGVLRFVSVIFAPVVWLLTASTNGLLRLFGINPGEDEEEVTEEEIMMMAEAGSEKGSIDSEENELIKNIFEFKEQTVGEVCTHRKDTDLLFLSESDEEWAARIASTRHTYYPICGKGIDDIAGVLSTKDYFRLDDKSRENVMKKAVSAAVFVTENTPANTLFYKMKISREYFAVVVDEYGGMSGIVTMHDLLELLVGDLTEKDDKEEYEISRLSETEWEITGLAPIDKVEASLGVKLPEEESEHFETFGGYVCGMMGTLPEDGASFELSTEQMNVRVLSVEDRCIKRVIVTLPERKAEEKASE
ncbi:MAG: HlyC/CorC family transporter [Clostridiales bacterium]|nr:MAG: HlyC/CorC family transporter [Clostridiales bacterium]